MTYSETRLERPLPWKTICLEGPHIPGRRSDILMHLNLSPKTTCYGQYQNIGWSFKTGSAVEYTITILTSPSENLNIFKKPYFSRRIYHEYWKHINKGSTVFMKMKSILDHSIVIKYGSLRWCHSSSWFLLLSGQIHLTATGKTPQHTEWSSRNKTYIRLTYMYWN